MLRIKKTLSIPRLMTNGKKRRKKKYRLYIQYIHTYTYIYIDIYKIRIIQVSKYRSLEAILQSRQHYVRIIHHHSHPQNLISPTVVAMAISNRCKPQHHAQNCATVPHTSKRTTKRGNHKKSHLGLFKLHLKRHINKDLFGFRLYFPKWCSWLCSLFFFFVFLPIFHVCHVINLTPGLRDSKQLEQPEKTKALLFICSLKGLLARYMHEKAIMHPARSVGQWRQKVSNYK